MRRPALPLALALVALLAAPALAQQGASAYDPLVLAHTLHVGPHSLVETPPQEGGLYFPASAPGQSPAALTLAWTSTAAVVAEADATLTLRLKSDKPLVARNADGNAMEVALLVDGQQVGKPHVLSFGDKLVLQPSDGADAFAFALPLSGQNITLGASVGLRFQPLLPAVTEGSLKIVLGGEDPSRMEMPALRLPNLDALAVQDARLPTFRLGEGPRPVQPYATLRVLHDRVELDAPQPTGGQRLATLVVEAAEGAEDARAHHAFFDPSARRAAAHGFAVGTYLVYAHPGTEVHVPLAVSTDGFSTLARCIQACPAGGWEARITLRDPTVVNQTDAPSTLVPPPRSTSGIPVSQDAPVDTERSLLPLPLVVPVGAIVLGACILGRRR